MILGYHMYLCMCSHPSAEIAIPEIVSVISGAIVGGGILLILIVGLLLFVMFWRRSQRGKVSR